MHYLLTIPNFLVSVFKALAISIAGYRVQAHANLCRFIQVAPAVAQLAARNWQLAACNWQLAARNSQLMCKKGQWRF